MKTSTTNGIQTRATRIRSNTSYSKEDKMETLRRVNDLKWKPTKAAKKLGCSLQTVLNWLASSEKNKPLYNYSHRPPLCSPLKRAELLNELKQNRKSGLLVSKELFSKKLQKKVNETQEEANNVPKTVSRRYIRDLLNKENLQIQDAEAESDSQ